MDTDNKTLKTVTHTFSGRLGQYKIIATTDVWNGNENDAFQYAVFLGNEHLVHVGNWTSCTPDGLWRVHAGKLLKEYVESSEKRKP